MNNMMHGKGILTFSDGRKYIGNFEEDKMEGLGHFRWPDGREFEGSWSGGLPEG